MTTIELFQRLGLALAIGLLMGLERGWEGRAEPEGMRVAGIRTFALIGLAGGAWGVLGLQFGGSVPAAAVLAFAALIVAAHIVRLRANPDVGITTEVAELVAFALALMAVVGDMAAAAAAAVVATALLNAKEALHTWVGHLNRLEMGAAIRLLLISVVMLPLLPDQGYGPDEILNPFTLWLLVVMVAAISFAGYFAIKIAGPRIGSLLTGLFGGIASSTALTISFARLGKTEHEMQPALAAGIALANATMYARLWVIVALLNADLARHLAPTMGAMALTGLAVTYGLWRMRTVDTRDCAARLTNPFELGMAIKFAALLAGVIVAAKLMEHYAGSTGLYALAGVAGLADVDAISLSMTELAKHGATGPRIAATVISIAVFVNTGVKAVWAGGLCGGTLARRTTLMAAAVIAAGGLVLWFTSRTGL